MSSIRDCYSWIPKARPRKRPINTKVETSARITSFDLKKRNVMINTLTNGIEIRKKRGDKR